MKSKLYPSVPLNAAYVEEGNEDSVRNGIEIKDPDRLGYFLIDGHLVPFLFLEKLDAELDSCDGHEPDRVLSAPDLFSERFLASLDPDEREVLMPCVLMLIEWGCLPINLYAEI